jgi:hypothetical protein
MKQWEMVESIEKWQDCCFQVNKVLPYVCCNINNTFMFCVLSKIKLTSEDNVSSEHWDISVSLYRLWQKLEIGKDLDTVSSETACQS